MPAVTSMIRQLPWFAIPRITLLITSVRSICWKGMLDPRFQPEDALMDYQHGPAEYGRGKTS